MEFQVVKKLLSGYVEYLALIDGVDIKIERNKIYNEYDYWFKEYYGDGNYTHRRVLCVQMGDLPENVVLFVYNATEFEDAFIDSGVDYVVQRRSMRVVIRDEEEIIDLFDKLYDVGYFKKFRKK
jgi:hypothetical protein